MMKSDVLHFCLYLYFLEKKKRHLILVKFVVIAGLLLFCLPDLIFFGKRDTDS
jgi:hypothetical protein